MESDEALSAAYTEYRESWNSLPFILKPVYETSAPNQPILLVDEEPLEIIQEVNQHKVKIQGHGSLKYEWFPSPCIKFEFFSDSSESIDIKNPYALLILLNRKTSVEVFLETIKLGKNIQVSGRTKTPLKQGLGQGLVYVLFHIANFNDFIGFTTRIPTQDSMKTRRNRITFEVESWRLTLDNLETIKSNVKQLTSLGGFAITHVGKLEKLDGTVFSDDEATTFLDIFANFLSFARGFRVPLILLVGYDVNGNETWKYSAPSIGDSWRGVASWFPDQNASILAEVFPGFLSWWRDWEESAPIILSWYLEANTTLLIQNKIILTQVALELIAWVLLVEKEASFSLKDFDKLQASKKIRELLSKFRIPPDIPQSSLTSSLTNLGELASDNKLIDGPHAFTFLRNGLVHPKSRKKVFDAPMEAIIETCDLGMWYLELVLLAIFNYQGIYASRLRQGVRYNGETEDVPWTAAL
ncbi:MAG: hypothetical protein KME05_12400 [Gloeocapsa sp. UFS-A4-WI-NPMV-4B04]|jgi:hypothetical protein|nr:hypothetical protein [Gloeocapsa sp. UFS-A4-WI-NPMV-4B04]